MSQIPSNAPGGTEPPKFTADREALEAEAAGATPGPDGVSDVPAAAGGAPRKDVSIAPVKSPADVARDGIYARFSENRGNLDESEVAMAEGTRALLAGETEGTPEPAPAAPARAAAPAPAAPAAAAPPLDAPTDTVTVVVDGRRIAVNRADIERAGIEAFQKTSSADFRLQRASRAEQALIVERQALDARARELEQSRGSSTPADGGRPGPSSDGTGNSDAVKKALEGLLEGDVETAASRLTQALEDVSRRSSATRAAPAAPAAPERPMADGPPMPWSQREIDLANERVVAAYRDMAYHPQASRVFTDRMAREMANPANRAGRVDLTTIALDIGREVSDELRATPPPRVAPPAPPANGVQDELAQRRTLAARVPVVPTAVSRTQDPRGTVVQPQSRSQAVAQMRKARGFE